MASSSSNPSVDLTSQHADEATDTRVPEGYEAGIDESQAVPLFQSPTSFTSDFLRGPDASHDLRRRTTTRAVLTPGTASSTQEPPENPEIHVADLSMSKALQRSIVHIVSIFGCSTLIALSARTVYFSDLNGFAGQAIVLQALQFFVKAHNYL